MMKWKFQFEAEGELLDETLFFFWKGQNATKGYSPLPAEFENEQTIVERVVQWSEPPVFFRIFDDVITTSGNDGQSNRLFVFRGELEGEIHFYEVPCLKSSLRSKSSFVLVQTDLKKATVWHGVNSPEIYKKKSLNRFEKLFGFPVTSSESLIDLVPGNNDFLTVHCNDNFTPKLFYLNSITGELQATLVQYSLASHQIARYPFLHSHLYSAITPASFILDNYSEVWLWTDSNEEENLKECKKIIIEYTKRVKIIRNIPIVMKHVIAGCEPLDFIHLFPYWPKISTRQEVDIIVEG
ncbi:supervillin [Aethina tumida]|uniref:supervillin n=1 Tax=Aethina tumida TaxID=116153 RepID=UPI0021485EF1|nr:supervillin [Aethina tumida]